MEASRALGSRVSLGTIPFYARRSATLISGAYRLIVFPGPLIMLIVLTVIFINTSNERNLKVQGVKHDL